MPSYLNLQSDTGLHLLGRCTCVLCFVSRRDLSDGPPNSESVDSICLALYSRGGLRFLRGGLCFLLSRFSSDSPLVFTFSNGLNCNIFWVAHFLICGGANIQEYAHACIKEANALGSCVRFVSIPVFPIGFNCLPRCLPGVTKNRSSS